MVNVGPETRSWHRLCVPSPEGSDHLGKKLNIIEGHTRNYVIAPSRKKVRAEIGNNRSPLSYRSC